MKKIIAIFTGLCAAVLTGCVSPEAPADSAGGMNGLQQRVLTSRNIGEELGATYDDVWSGTVAALQLNGFILKQADKSAGYIYGVWQNSYERQTETSNGGFAMVNLPGSATYSFGSFFTKTAVFKQVDVSVTLEPLEKTQTLVRLSARFDNQGNSMAEGVFANRFFGLLRKEIFLRKNNGSLYHAYTTTTK